jgi:hypothetical protein
VESNGQGKIWYKSRERVDKIIVVVGGVEGTPTKKLCLSVHKYMALEPFLYDYPDVVIKFMWEKYSKSERTMKYVESCARADITLGGEQQRVIEGFDSLENYLDRKKWRDAPVPRIQQEPGWDNMPIRKQGNGHLQKPNQQRQNN